MTLAIEITWPEGRYDAATTDPAVAEWPPSPVRVFAALRASARSSDDLDALRWLENQPAPTIVAEPTTLGTRHESAYVVVNDIKKDGGNLTHPGRTNNVRARVGSSLHDGTATLLWPDAEPRPDVIATLDRLAADVPYLGRTTSPALLRATAEPRSVPAPAFVPAERSGIRIPVPYPGLVDALDDLYATNGRAHEAYRDMQAYRYDDGSEPDPESPVAPAVPAVYDNVLTFRLPTGVHLAGQLTGVLTTALRRAALKVMDPPELAGEPMPAVLSGHGADGRPHAAFLALPNVGGTKHADGHLLALAVAIPPADGVGQRLAALARELKALRVPGIGTIELDRRADHRSPRGARAARWVGPATTWQSATPVVLDRFPRRQLTEEDVVADGCVAAGFPRPRSVELRRSPFVDGGVMVRRHQVPFRDRGDRRPLRHVRLEFEAQVTGPVLVGALRHLGFGLCAPVHDVEG